MALINWGWNWDPWRELGRLGRGLGHFGRGRHRHAYPPVNVYEADDAYGLEVEVPGVAPEDLEFTVEGDLITVSGQKKVEGGEGTFHRHERPHGRFSRSLRLPAALDAEKVEAHYQDGVLMAKLPKAAEAKARKVAVKTN
jgi:HSP20 family protein